MPIDDIFPFPNSIYLVTSHDARDPADVAKELIGKNLAVHQRNLAWVFYRVGPFGLINVCDGVSRADDDDRLSVARTYGDGNGFARRGLTISASRYLDGVQELYLQLCSVYDPVGPRAGGIEKTPQGSRIGHYPFAIPLLERTPTYKSS